ncbi:MAG: hypothetical protein WCX69_00705 [Candidatus Paceibacterota bacterium]
MPLPNIVMMKKAVACFALAICAAMVLFCGDVFAENGPVIKNLNPQGLVTSQNPEISLNTEDLAACRYSTTDTSYDSMSNKLASDNGEEHSAKLGSLGKGAYTYYVRCKDFEGNSNGTSATAKFTVGDVTCVGDNCQTPPSGDTVAPTLSNFLPTGTATSKYVTLSVTTNESSSCRFSWYANKTYETMTLPFTSSDKLYHTATASLYGTGNYVTYVLCKDVAGNVNQTVGRISFYYNAPYVAPKQTTVKEVVTPADKTPPVISSLAPSGDVDKAAVTISCTTDEVAVCKYGTVDGEFDSLTDTMDTAGGLSHSKNITLAAAGKYTYYVRCKDAKGNKGTVSS